MADGDPEISASAGTGAETGGPEGTGRQRCRFFEQEFPRIDEVVMVEARRANDAMRSRGGPPRPPPSCPRFPESTWLFLGSTLYPAGPASGFSPRRTRGMAHYGPSARHECQAGPPTSAAGSSRSPWPTADPRGCPERYPCDLSARRWDLGSCGPVLRPPSRLTSRGGGGEAAGLRPPTRSSSSPRAPTSSSLPPPALFPRSSPLRKWARMSLSSSTTTRRE